MMKVKKPIIEFTFQDAEYITTKLSELIKGLIALIGGFVNGIKAGEIYTYGAEAAEEEAEA